MNEYEAKQERRRERLERAAELARKRAAGANRTATAIWDGIPFGQPILVGHHSEKRHRNALRKADNAMRRSLEESKRAHELEARAAAVGTAGISSDDPDAPSKIRERIAELEAEHARMKDVNARFRKGDTKALTAEEGRAFLALLRVCPHERQPYPGYAISNSSANIRRLKERLAEVERRAGITAPEPKILAGDVRLEQSPEDNRTRLYFPGKPPVEVRARLKANGFRWSPTEGAWQRHYQDSAMSAYLALGYRYDSEAREWRAPAGKEETS